MREWEDIHRQITEVLAECGLAPPGGPIRAGRGPGLRPHPPFDPERVSLEHRGQEGEEPLPRGQGPRGHDLPRLGALQLGRQLGRRGRDGGDLAPVRAHGGDHRPRLAGAAGRRAVPVDLPRPALGRPARRGGGDRAGHPLRAHHRPGACGRLRADPAGGGRGHLRPRRARGGRGRPPLPLSAPQPGDDRPGRGHGGPAAAPGPARLRRGPRGLLPPPAARGERRAHARAPDQDPRRGRVPAHDGGGRDRLAAGRGGARPLPAGPQGRAPGAALGVPVRPGRSGRRRHAAGPARARRGGAGRSPSTGWCRGCCARRWRPCSGGFPSRCAGGWSR